MLGYIKIFPEQLKLCDAEAYRRVYCGLCHQIALYSQLSRCFLSFDMVFFAILSAYERETLPGLCVSRHCLRRAPCGDETMDYWACVSVLLIVQKLRNDVRDGEKGKKALLFDLRSAYGRARAKHPDTERMIADALDAIDAMEKAREPDPERTACRFGELTRGIMAASFPPDMSGALKEVLRGIAVTLSEWLYCLDFYDDLEDDRKRGQYNPLLIGAKQGGYDLAEARSRFRPAVDRRVAQLQRACAFLPYGGFHNIVKNVLHEGVVSVTADVYDRRHVCARRR